MIPQETVAKIREATDIVQLVGRFVKLKRAGANWKGLCPFHNEKSPSFNVHPAKQIFHCFGCQEGGDVFSFLMKKEKLNFSEALRMLAGEAGIEIEESSPEAQEEEKREAREREQLYELLKLATQWFRRNFSEGKEAEHARAYAKKRGMDEAIQERFQIGYAPSDPEALERAALKKGFSRQQLMQAGLISVSERGSYARFRGRLIFPIEDSKAQVVGFGGRILGEGEPKYLNSPETRLFSKGRLLYAFPQAKDAVSKKRRILICEGYMDALACHQAGVEEAVAVLGTALTEDHARLIKRYASEVLLVFDADQAGLRAARRGCETLLSAGLEPKVVRLGSFKDPDEFIKAKGREAFERELAEAGDALAFLATTSVEVARAQKGSELSLREKAKLVQELFPLLSRYGTAMETATQLERLSGLLSLSLDAVKEDFKAYEEAPKRQQEAFSDEERPQPQAAGEGGVLKPKPRRPNLERAEEELLALLVSHPDLIEEARLDLPEPDFCREDLLAGQKLLWDHPKQALAAIQDDGSEEYSLGEPLLSRLAMQSGEKFTEPLKHLKTLLLKRQLLKLEEKSADIQKALESGAPGAEQMLQEKSQLTRAIKDVKQMMAEA